MVDFVEKKGPPPQDLLLKWQCDQYRIPPRSGGILDQPAGLLERMHLLNRIYGIWSRWIKREPGHEKEWTERYPEDWEIVLEIMDLLRADKQEAENGIHVES